MFRREIFDYIGAGEELVSEPFARLIAERASSWRARTRGSGRRWTRSRTSRTLEALFHAGSPPWALWQSDPVRVR